MHVCILGRKEEDLDVGMSVILNSHPSENHYFIYLATVLSAVVEATVFPGLL